MYGAGAEYALHSLLTLATHPEPVSLRDLATFQKIPERFLASKSLDDLVCEFKCKAPAKFGRASEHWFQQRRDSRNARKTV